MLSIIFGDSTEVKILDFFMDYPRYSYTIEEISNKLNIKLSEAENIVRKFSSYKILNEVDGKFMLNLEDDLVTSLLSYDFNHLTNLIECGG